MTLQGEFFAGETRKILDSLECLTTCSIPQPPTSPHVAVVAEGFGLKLLAPHPRGSICTALRHKQIYETRCVKRTIGIKDKVAKLVRGGAASSSVSFLICDF